MKVPEPKKLPSGSWFIQLRLNGVSVPVTASTKSECKRAAELIKAEHRAGKRQISAKPKDMTLRQIVESYNTIHKSVLSPSTLLGYENVKKNRFKAYMDLPVSQINWQAMISDELKDKSEKTVKNGWGVVRTALAYHKLPIPEVKLAQVPVKEIPFLQPEEIRPFCEAVKGRPYEIPALLELHGLRLSEVRGLTWDNIDIERELIHIKGSKVRGVDGDIRKDTNKNRTSTRTIPIMIPQLLTALKAVENKTGEVMTIGPQTLIRDVNRACKRAGVTVTGNHGLRHSFASMCYFLRIPDRQVQEWGGWADYMTMHKIYIRLAASDESKSKDLVSGFFQPKNANENANGK